MVQMLIPVFPEDMTLINYRIGFQKQNGMVYYSMV